MVEAINLETQERNNWKKLNRLFQDFLFENDLSFVKRLARENNWSLEFAHEVCEEYIKFIFLMNSAGHPVTPSDEVDQAWHLHMQYSRHYIKMSKIFGKDFLHHEPTKGGKNEDNKFINWYEKTKLSYISIFKQLPPKHIWPSSEIRFKVSPQAFRINPEKYVILERKILNRGLIIIGSGLLVIILASFF